MSKWREDPLKIDRIPFPQQPDQAGPAGTGKNRPGPAPAGSADRPDGGPAAVTHLSRAGGQATGDIDAARVDELRQAIADGKLEIRADRIADALLDDVHSLLDREP